MGRVGESRLGGSGPGPVEMAEAHTETRASDGGARGGLREGEAPAGSGS